MRVDAFPQLQGVQVELHRQLVDGLLQRERPLRMPWRAHGCAGAGIGEDVVLFGMDGCVFVEVLGWARASRAGPAAGGAIADEMNAGDGAVLLGADAQHLVGAWAIADRKVFLLPVQHQPHRRAGLL